MVGSEFKTDGNGRVRNCGFSVHLRLHLFAALKRGYPRHCASCASRVAALEASAESVDPVASPRGGFSPGGRFPDRRSLPFAASGNEPVLIVATPAGQLHELGALD